MLLFCASSHRTANWGAEVTSQLTGDRGDAPTHGDRGDTLPHRGPEVIPRLTGLWGRGPESLSSLCSSTGTTRGAWDPSSSASLSFVASLGP